LDPEQFVEIGFHRRHYDALSPSGERVGRGAVISHPISSFPSPRPSPLEAQLCAAQREREGLSNQPLLSSSTSENSASTTSSSLAGASADPVPPSPPGEAAAACSFS